MIIDGVYLNHIRFAGEGGERDRKRERWEGGREREQKSDSLASRFIDSIIYSYDAIPRETVDRECQESSK